MLAAQGRVIFGHAASGKISPVGEPDAVIAWAEALTVPIARAFLASGSSILLTRTGNQVCHGANLLRVAMLQGRKIGWLTNLSATGMGHASVAADGAVTVHSGNVKVTETSAGAPRALFEHAPAGRVAVCLWPDRTYSAAEFNMQQVGLMASASSICNNRVEVSIDPRGRVWFESAVLDPDFIRRQALNRDRAGVALTAMTKAFDGLAAQIATVPVGAVDAGLLRALGSSFFAHLLLFHECYGEVMATAAEALRAAADPALLLDIASTNAISRWLYDLPEFQDAAKHGTAADWWGVLPDLTVKAATEQTVREIREATGPARLWTEDIEWLATMAVAKEMKMVLAKNLFAGTANLEGDGTVVG